MDRKTTSLRRKSDFDAVYKHARAYSDRLLAVRARSRPGATNEPTRIGYVTTKALGNAVTRNKIKRRLRAAIAALRDDLTPGLDIIISARKPAATAPYPALTQSLRTLLTRAHALTTHA